MFEIELSHPIDAESLQCVSNEIEFIDWNFLAVSLVSNFDYVYIQSKIQSICN